jgi:hypothetical protein
MSDKGTIAHSRALMQSCYAAGLKLDLAAMQHFLAVIGGIAFPDRGQ